MTHAQFRFAAIGKSFGQRRVLEDVGIELNAGHCVLLSGRNGSGKSTLLRILAGMQKPDRGEVDFGGGPLPWRRCSRYLQQHILYLHQQPYMFDGDVRYNLGYALRRGKDKKSLVAAALHWGGLEGMAHSPARSLSGGERQRLALARAWLRRPAAMLLDEPTA
ncbi:MAG TPA: ATP-binding cassette domain-containing protein, partial [Chromatiaceae bacterium]|nr:ATP-binding cassette domain-containing protein [Chromatiaceae bacterium]